MDWKKAKNYTIIFLLILNVLLLTLNILKEDKHHLNQSRKKAILDVLSNNDILVNCSIPDDFSPMAQLNLRYFNHDILELKNIFMKDTSNIKISKEFEKTILKNEKEILSVQGNNVYYENNSTDDNFIMNKGNAIKKCAAITDKINKIYSKMDFCKFSQTDEYILLEYNQKYKDKIIFNNCIIVHVYSDGKMSIEFSYSQPLELSEKSFEICSSDEALFVFYSEIGKVVDIDKMSIDKIELGYYSNTDLNANISASTAAAHYRIYIDSMPEHPFFINACTSKLVLD